MKHIRLFLLSLLLPMLLCIDGIAQTQPVTPEAFHAEIDKAIAAYPNGAKLYEESDNFQRLIYAQVAHKLGLMQNQSTITNNKLKTQSLSNLYDLTPDIDDEDEASIAISRVDPNLIVAGANDLPGMNTGSMPAYVSTDAGQNWKTYRLPIVNDAEVQAFGDPMLICDDSGMFYYSFLISSEQTSTSGAGFISDLMVARSPDGINWTLGTPVLGNATPDISSEDKETIAVDRDPKSPYYHRIYIVWTHYLNEYALPTETLISHSDNHGVTWSSPISIPTIYGYFALLRVGNGGTVFIAASHRDSLTDTGTFHAMIVSHDGGQTFSQSIISSYKNYPSGNYPNELKGSVKAFPYVNFDVDPSNNKLFVVYGTYLGDSIFGYAGEYAVTSTDEGVSWSIPQQIGTTAFDAPGLLATDHFQPWVTFDPAIDKARVSMYSSEEDPTNRLTRMVLFDFDAPTIPQELGADLFDPTAVISHVAYVRYAPFIGDYTSADAYNGTFAAAWTEIDPNGTDGDVFARIESPTGSVSITKINESNLALQDPSPNPVTGNSILFVASSSINSIAHLTLFDLNGRAVISTQLELTPGDETSVTLDIHTLSAGVYSAVLDSDGKMVKKNVVILH